jgi:serine protein kinase
MRGIEEKIGVTEARKGDFRRGDRELHRRPGRARRGLHLPANPRLRSALELKLFEDCRDTFKLTAGPEHGHRPRRAGEGGRRRGRLVRDKGYCERCAARVLERVAGLFARGDTKTPAEEAA